MLGSALLEKFVAQGWYVTALRNKNEIKYSHELINPVRVNIENISELKEALAGRRFDAFIHCAASTNLELCESDFSAALAANVIGTKNLLEVVMATGGLGTKVVYISSDAVYPDVDGPKSEDIPPRPATIYGATKLWGENLTLMFAPDALILRTTIVGPDAGQFCSWILKHAAESRPVPLFSDVLFTPISCEHLSDVILAALAKNLAGIYNAGGAEVISKADFGQVVLSEAGIKCSVELTSLKSMKSRVKRSFNMSLNSSRFYRDLGIEGFKIRDTIRNVLKMSSRNGA
jgi:dTDP-4-dehydrorhamnose reductase